MKVKETKGSTSPSLCSSSISSAMREDEEDGPCLAALSIFLGEAGGRQNNGSACDLWLSCTRELRLVSFTLCNICRTTLPFRVWIGENTPRSLWVSSTTQENDGGSSPSHVGTSTVSNSSCADDRGSTPLRASASRPRRRVLRGIRATTVVWDRPADELLSSAQNILGDAVRLKFGFHFNNPLVPRTSSHFRWPETLVFLDLGVRFQQDLSGVFFPSTLVELRLGALFNRSLQGVAWPSRLARLTLGASFNKPIIGVRWPATLKHLQFGVSFDQPLIQRNPTTGAPDSVLWPPLLESLTFGIDFSHDVGRRGDALPIVPSQDRDRACSCSGVLPPSLKRLTLSQGFSQPLDTVAWPQGLEELDLDCVYVADAWGGRLPTGLRRLRIDLNFHQSNRDVMPLLPDTLEELTFGSNFNQSMRGVEWPLGLKKLSFGASFNQPIEGDSIRFPPRIEELSFGFRFNQPIVGVTWPTSLLHLTFRDHFNQPIAAVSWPKGLKELRFGRMFDKPFWSGGEVVRWPLSLCKLTLGKNFNQPVQDLCLPPSLVELELSEGCKQQLEGVKWPARLRMVTVGRGWRCGVMESVTNRLSMFPIGCRLKRR